jgi:energy-converting hydrogenase Eha subunit F
MIIPSARILPSNKTTYTLPQLQNAIKSQTGAVPYFGCQKNGTVLTEVWYFNHVYGTVCLFSQFFAANTLMFWLTRNSTVPTRRLIR